MSAHRVRLVLFGLAVIALPPPVHAGDPPTETPKAFLEVPVPNGWSSTSDQPSNPRVAGVQLTSEDGSIDVSAATFVLAFGHQQSDGASGTISAADWLPAGRQWLGRSGRWLPVSASRRCFWVSSLLEHSDGGPFRYSGQARCRGENFALVFNFFSRADRRRSMELWGAAFKKIVLETKTDASCLTPEEMTAIATSEGPPFATRPIVGGGVEVAPSSLCGSGGCWCARFYKVSRCFRFIRLGGGCGNFE